MTEKELTARLVVDLRRLADQLESGELICVRHWTAHDVGGRHMELWGSGDLWLRWRRAT